MKASNLYLILIIISSFVLSACPNAMVNLIEKQIEPNLDKNKVYRPSYMSGSSSMMSIQDYSKYVQKMKDSLIVGFDRDTNGLPAADQQKLINKRDSINIYRLSKSGFKVDSSNINKFYSNDLSIYYSQKNAIDQTIRDRRITLSADSLKNDEEEQSEFKIMSEIFTVNSDGFPDSVDFEVRIFDSKGNTISGLAPPFTLDTNDWEKYWEILSDSCKGAKTIVPEFSVLEVRANTSKPYALCFVLDHSSSMGEDRIKLLQKTVKAIFKGIKKRDWVSVVKFTSTATVEVPLMNNKETYTSLMETDGNPRNKYGQGTNIKLAMDTAIAILSRADKNLKRIAILFSDGQDGSNFDKTILEARKQKVTFYTIGYGMADYDLLDRIAKLTGGRFYQILFAKEFPHVFKGILSSLNNYYRVTYKPPHCSGKHYIELSNALPQFGLSGIKSQATYDKSLIAEDVIVGTVTFIDIEFEFGKSEVRSESIPLIQQVAEAMKSNTALAIKIAGHTDDIGKTKDNLILSTQRAESVKNILVSMGINPERIETEGFGESKPLVANDSDENRKRNRRTEFIVIKNK